MGLLSNLLKKKEDTTKSENVNVTGTSHYLDNIMKLAKKNSKFNSSKEDIIKSNFVNQNIYEYTFKDYTAELIPEPTNEHDPNAIQVLINGKVVGYIKKGSCSHIKNLISSGSIKSVTASITGGNYIRVDNSNGNEITENFYLHKEKFEISIKLHIVLN